MIWHEFDIMLSDKSLEEMGIKKRSSAKAMVSLENVYTFHSSYNDEGEEVTLIMFMNGDMIQVNQTYEEVKKIMRCK